MSLGLVWFIILVLAGGLVWSYVKQVEELNKKLRKLEFKVSVMGRYIMDKEEEL
tara:strand:+ start:3308 stop:3469 length:162 start_codon:yes stop_codon:yes gene_type:complete